eukprot:scaffold2858_cov659-Pavlova_lutheri.AAC.76
MFRHIKIPHHRMIGKDGFSIRSTSRCGMFSCHDPRNSVDLPTQCRSILHRNPFILFQGHRQTRNGTSFNTKEYFNGYPWTDALAESSGVTPLRNRDSYGLISYSKGRRHAHL